MAARLAAAESELRAARAEVAERDAKIRELEQRLSTLPRPHSPLELEKKYLALQSQVEEMEVIDQPTTHTLSQSLPSATGLSE